MSDAMITVEEVRRSFGDVKALDGVSLEVQRGAVLGLLGPNGAGKTTLVRVLTTLLRLDSGRATVAGLDVTKDTMALRSVIGLAGQSAAVDPDLYGIENLVMVGRLYHLSTKEARRRAEEVLEADPADRGRLPAGQDLLRWNAPPTGPGRLAGRPPHGAVHG